MLKITRHKGGRGLAGGAGLQGPQGLKGDQGVAGVAGAVGAKGDQGIAGVAGAKGDQGLKGDQGVQGIAGVAGAVGAVGEGFYEAMTTLLQYTRTKPEFLNQMMEGIQASRAQIGAANATVWGGDPASQLANFQKFDTIIRRDWDMWAAYIKSDLPDGTVNFVSLGNPQSYLQQGGGGFNSIVMDLKKLLVSYSVPVACVSNMLAAAKQDIALNINSNTEPEGGQTATVVYEVLFVLSTSILSSNSTLIDPIQMPNCLGFTNALISGQYGNPEVIKVHIYKIIERILKNLEEVSIESGFGNITDVASDKTYESQKVGAFLDNVNFQAV
jgi:hypothetical protein